MRAHEFLNETPLPSDWEHAQFTHGKSSFKKRLEYALDRASKIGAGSSRVAMIIEYEGRPTVLKVAKNAKGLAQNEAEAAILSDGYASKIGILIPIIDYDESDSKPTWIHTELAQKATEKQLCNIMKCVSLRELVRYAECLGGISRFDTRPEFYTKQMRDRGMSESDIETVGEYASALIDLATSFNVKLGDFTRKANWGIYKGNPVIIDVGFTADVMKAHYSR